MKFYGDVYKIDRAIDSRNLCTITLKDGTIVDNCVVFARGLDKDMRDCVRAYSVPSSYYRKPVYYFLYLEDIYRLNIEDKTSHVTSHPFYNPLGDGKMRVVKKIKRF